MADYIISRYPANDQILAKIPVTASQRPSRKRRETQELLDTSNLPQNLFQIVFGDGTVGAALTDTNPNKIFFTGSVATGNKIIARASELPPGRGP